MRRIVRMLVPMVSCLALLAAPTFAGTQDFTLVNQTGTEIYNLYISETSNEEWEEDVLGENTLASGGRLRVTFSGRSACLWDMLVKDEDENEVRWTGINLCEVSVVVLKCGGGECWAEFE
jgi:hypothetical protein